MFLEALSNIIPKNPVGCKYSIHHNFIEIHRVYPKVLPTKFYG